MYWASQNKQNRTVALLLEHGAPLDDVFVPESAHEALQLSDGSPAAGGVRKFVASEAEAAATPLYWAAREGNVQRVKDLLYTGGNPNAVAAGTSLSAKRCTTTKLCLC